MYCAGLERWKRIGKRRRRWWWMMRGGMTTTTTLTAECIFSGASIHRWDFYVCCACWKQVLDDTHYNSVAICFNSEANLFPWQTQYLVCSHCGEGGPWPPYFGMLWDTLPIVKSSGSRKKIQRVLHHMHRFDRGNAVRYFNPWCPIIGWFWNITPFASIVFQSNTNFQSSHNQEIPTIMNATATGGQKQNRPTWTRHLFIGLVAYLWLLCTVQQKAGMTEKFCLKLATKRGGIVCLKIEKNWQRHWYLLGHS